MGTRRQRPQLPARTAQPPAQVHHRHVFEHLLPSLRATALRMAEGNLSRVVVLTRTSFEVPPPPKG
jgi:hypothetical protein